MEKRLVYGTGALDPEIIIIIIINYIHPHPGNALLFSAQGSRIRMMMSSRLWGDEVAATVNA